MSRQLLMIVLLMLAVSAWAEEKKKDEVVNQTLAQNSAGRIYMVNLNRWGYSRAMGFKIDGWMLKADRRCYSFIAVPSGTHEIEYGKDKIPIAVEAGKAYYFTLIEQAMGWGGFRISRLSEEEADFDLKMLKPDQKQIDEAASHVNSHLH